SALSRAVASRPSIPASWISIRIRSGCSSRASVNPTSASVALSTVWPADSSRNTANVMLAGLSSTIRTLAMSGDHLATRHGPADFGHKAVGVELDLVHDRRHITTQLRTVVGGDLLGGEHQDRDASRVGMFVERLRHLE